MQCDAVRYKVLLLVTNLFCIAISHVHVYVFRTHVGIYVRAIMKLTDNMVQYGA